MHCRSGISRSGAVARAVTERYGLAFDGEERGCNAHVLTLLRAVPVGGSGVTIRGSRSDQGRGEAGE